MMLSSKGYLLLREISRASGPHVDPYDCTGQKRGKIAATLRVHNVSTLFLFFGNGLLTRTMGSCTCGKCMMSLLESFQHGF
jgi:hypothetical protein